jgi:murein peptide amidase A
MHYTKTFIFGRTSQNLPIPAYNFGHTGPRILILGGVHGDEIEGVQAAHGLLGAFEKNFHHNLHITLVPAFNLDGILAKERKNGHGVDLNRNLPTLDWSPVAAKESYFPGAYPASEPENQALVKYIDEHKPKFILSLHSWNPMLNINGDCKKIAQVISSHTGYIITDDIGYPTPGSLGTYCGMERHIPTLTYEIERYLPCKEVLRIHVPAILEGLKVYER